MTLTHEITCDPAELPEASAEDNPSDHMLEAMCPHCRCAVDAVCPECGGNVESSGSEPKGTVLSRAEYYRRLLLMLEKARNTKFMLGCYFIATGDRLAEGVSMTDYSRIWSVKKATVSKQCRFICAYLGIPPSRYMREEKTIEKFRTNNRRPRKAE
jgi:hypothetical protein